MAASSTCFSPADRDQLRLLVGTQLLRACGQAGVLDSELADKRADMMLSARDKVSADKGEGLSKHMEGCQGLGLETHDVEANALVLALRDMSMQLDDTAKQVQVALVGMGERHKESLVAVDNGFEARVTTLGCLACEWISQLHDLREQAAKLRDHSCVVRYSTEKIATLGNRAGQVTKLLAIRLGLGDSVGKRNAIGLSVDWAVWLLKLIRSCSVMIACARQLGQSGEDVNEIETLLAKVNEVLGAEVLGELVRGIDSEHKSEWEYLGQLHEVARGALAWVHSLAGREYDTQALRERALREGHPALSMATQKILAKSMSEKAASSAVAKAHGAGGNLLETLAAENPKHADELRQIDTLAALLGPLPQWETAALKLANQDLGLENEAVQGG